MLRLHLTSAVTVQAGSTVLLERDLPGRQGRLALVYLVLNRRHPVDRDELAAAIWGDRDGPAESSLAPLLSRLRGTLGRATGAGPSVLATAGGCHQLRLPADTWVDVEAMTSALDRAQSAIRAHQWRAGWADAAVAQAIARRPLLPGEDRPWVHRARADLQASAVRALQCVTAAWTALGDGPRAVRAASEAVELAPYSEECWRTLMQAHAANGDRAEALRAFDRLRRRLGEELGVDPSPQTEELYVALLRR